MAIKVIPDGSRKGGGGMDIGKTPKKRPTTKKIKKDKPASRVSDQDVERMATRIANMVRSRDAAGRVSNQDIDRVINLLRGKAKGMMKGGKAKKMMAGGGKAKKMMRGGGKTKKYMARGGKVK